MLQMDSKWYKSTKSRKNTSENHVCNGIWELNIADKWSPIDFNPFPPGLILKIFRNITPTAL